MNPIALARRGHFPVASPPRGRTAMLVTSPVPAYNEPMKLDLARRWEQFRDLCILTNNVAPAWLRVLFVAACAGLVIQDWDRFNAMRPFTNLYITFCAVVAFTSGWLIVHQVRRGLAIRRAEGREA